MEPPSVNLTPEERAKAVLAKFKLPPGLQWAPGHVDDIASAIRDAVAAEREIVIVNSTPAELAKLGDSIIDQFARGIDRLFEAVQAVRPNADPSDDSQDRVEWLLAENDALQAELASLRSEIGKDVEIVAAPGTEFGVLREYDNVVVIACRHQGEDWPHGQAPESSSTILPGYARWCMNREKQGG